MKQNQQQQSEVNDSQQNTDEDLSENQGEQSKVDQQIRALDEKISALSKQIRTKETEIADTKAAIKALQEEIAELKERIKERDAILKQKLRSIQQNGGQLNYLDVLVGASDFSEFVTRANNVSRIAEFDKNMMDQQIADKEALEVKENEVQLKLENLEEQLAELETLNQQLNVQREEKSKLMEQLQVEEHALHEKKQSLEEEEAILKAQEAAIQTEIQNWERQERLRKQREAEARAAAERAAAARNSNQPSAYSGGGEKPPVTSGMFMRPANGPVTSEYGMRWGELHAGIDIGKRGGHVPAVAVADGTVFRSYYSSSYGNVVFVTHNINGQVYTSVYAHMENRTVSSGTSVSKGDTLGYLGNTGYSLGAHLHFELHVGPWNGRKSNSVNPRSYINF
ncbi:murein hydrolase activator EnvC family protein [Aureibacillus halotolerans]|nr:peptidoglycan DD-metalloendopeptidase family protein [Aureibacillus halotolerans]